MNHRQPIGYVIRVDGIEVTLNLLDHHRGMVASHAQGVSTVTEIGSLVGVDAGHQILVLKVLGVSFAEPREAHRHSSDEHSDTREPLRNLSGVIVGIIARSRGGVAFVSSSLTTPALGAMVYPLENTELASILGEQGCEGVPIHIGDDLRSGATVSVGLQDLISRHVAVLGSSGQGKSCFTAAVLQQIVKLPKSKTVIFDVNGEYQQALGGVDAPDWVKVTKLGAQYKVPYFALGRQGIQRLLIPSEKTQRPALIFALENLHNIKWFDADGGAGLVGEDSASLFDDCRTGSALNAHDSLNRLRAKSVTPAQQWPPMKAIAPLVADSYSVARNNRGDWERNAFSFGNVAPLITRIHRFVEDPMFESVIDTGGGEGSSSPLDWHKEATKLVTKVFGNSKSKWRVHIVDLRLVSHDLMPFILGALLELYAFELFRRGQENKVPTLLVLEEAHHYLRPAGFSDDDPGSALAYERLAKEGRKFGLALWLSTQRPSEISTTVLSQCNNWISFKLNSERDLAAIQAASEWADRREVKRIAGLARQNAIAFGGSIRMPILLRAPTADPLPNSEDASFDTWSNSR